jgi:hypothetical protein
MLMVPESGRFQVGFAKLTVVDSADERGLRVAGPAADRRWVMTSVAGRYATVARRGERAASPSPTPLTETPPRD